MRRLLQHKRKFLPLFIGLLLIGLLIGLTIPLTGSATGGGDPLIDDLFVMAPQDDCSLANKSNPIRFAFSVNSLNYPDVGIVYSYIDPLPSIGVGSCVKVPCNNNYTQGQVDGIAPPSGRFWAQIKAKGFLQKDNGRTLYVRPYVNTGSECLYGEVLCTTPAETMGHRTHTVLHPDSTNDSYVSLLEPESRSGDCCYCGAKNITQYMNPTMTQETFTGSSSGTYVRKANIRSNLLSNGKHFYPHSSNGNLGNDLLIEFSLLYNETLANLKNGSVAIGRISNSGGGDDCNAFYLNLGNNTPGQWSPYAGSFESGSFLTVEYGPTGIAQPNSPEDQYPKIGGYGWHRIAVRIHEDAWKNGSSVNYKMTVTLYVDGLEVSRLSGTPNNNNLLFTASVVNGQLQYTDIPEGRYVYGFRLSNRQTQSGTTADFIYTDYTVSCGREFVQNVEPIYTPLDYFWLDYPSPIYFKQNMGGKIISVLPTSSQVGETSYLSPDGLVECTEPLSYNTYQIELNAVKAAVNAFSSSQFGTAHSSMPAGSYVPPATPTSAHPRVLFTADKLPAIRAAFNSSENVKERRYLLGSANRYTSSPTDPSNGNYSASALDCIRSNAFLYQITGIQLYGYRAIKLMKEFLLNLGSIPGSNICRRYGETMFSAACVYDWCYPLLTSADREQLIRGVQHKCCENKMEVGFPPAGSVTQHAISGHGSERQILRDYLSFAIAIYGNDSTWYKYVAKRIYQDYVPVRNEYYKSHYSPQGLSGYLAIRFGSDLWSAWLLKTATGQLPYADQTNMKAVLHSAYSRVTNGDDLIFGEGDDESHSEWQSGREILRQLATSGMIAGYLFNDPIAMRWAEYADHNGYVDSVSFMILRSSGIDHDINRRHEGLSPICYNGGFIGTLVAHNKWTNAAVSDPDDSVSVLMKIGGRTTANHDHQDAGSFQIYYKALLAGDAGYYDVYNSEHHLHYHQATIAHNSIVLYRSTGSTTYTVIQQNAPGETSSFNTWKTSDDYKTAEVKGVAYKQESGTADYAYIAGDIADAYDSSVVTRLDRRMLAVFKTNNPDVPMYFFVFDYIVTTNASDKKVFLIHTLVPPEIDAATNSATITVSQGKLVVQPVYCGKGSPVLEAVECNKSTHYNVGGSNFDTVNNKDDCYWGRLEISPNQNSKYLPMLNVMFVADKYSSATASSLPAYHFANTKVQGAAIGNTVAVFVTQEDPIAESVGFYTTGVPSGTKNYYVSNLAAGNWVVHYGNNTLPNPITVTEEGHFMTFSAPTGTIVLEYLGSN